MGIRLAKNPYNDPDYRLAKKLLDERIRNGQEVRCEIAAPGCIIWATTIDHDPPLAYHEHTRDSGCCTLYPACQPCQSRQGAEIANNRRDTGYDWPPPPPTRSTR